MNDPWQILRDFEPHMADQRSLERRQTDWLMNCLGRNQDCCYGKQHHFEKIQSIQNYRKRVPLVRYDDLRPFIERIAQGKADILFRGRPIAFEQTGGSSGGNKLIPYTADSLVDFQRGILPWLGSLVNTHGLADGCIYFALSPATRQSQSTAGGIPIGLSDGAYLGPVAGQALLQLSVLPSWVGELSEIASWQLASLYWLIRRPDLALISVWSPSFMIQLLQGLIHQQDSLTALLANGGNLKGHVLAADRTALERYNHYLEVQDSRELWPDLKVVSCWMDGASRTIAESLQQLLPQAHFQAKGLLATEGVTTVPDRSGKPVLTADSGFYEFLDCDGTARCAWELASEEAYELVLTNAGGLYRYRTGDLLRVVGQSRSLPVLRFIGRSDLSSDLVGEKLTEAFVARYVTDLDGFNMLAPVTGDPPHYTLITDFPKSDRLKEYLQRLELALQDNPQYAYARKLGQLGPLTLTFHPAPLDVYTAKAAQQQRLGDVKVPALLPPTMKTEWFMKKPV